MGVLLAFGAGVIVGVTYNAVLHPPLTAAWAWIKSKLHLH